MTQLELARHLGYANETTVSRLENGHRQVTARHVIELSRILGVSPNWLLLGEERFSADTGYIDF